MPGCPQMATGPGCPLKGCKNIPLFWGSSVFACQWESSTSLPLGWGCPVPRGCAGHRRMQRGGCIAPSPREHLLSQPGDTHLGDIPKRVLPILGSAKQQHVAGVFCMGSKVFSFFPPASTVVSEQVSPPELSLHPTCPGDRGTRSLPRRDGRETHCPAQSKRSPPPRPPQHPRRIFPLFFPFQQAPSLLLKHTKTKTKEEGSNPLHPSPLPSSPLRPGTVRGDVPAPHLHHKVPPAPPTSFTGT